LFPGKCPFPKDTKSVRRRKSNGNHNDVNAWVSDEDIAKGANWPISLQQELHNAKFGMICVTPENVAEPWILFEAGALSRAIDQSDVRVCPYLFGLETTDLKPPLGHFNGAKADRADTLKVVRSINDAVKASEGLYLSPQKLESAFEKWWPDLEQALQAIPVTRAKNQNRRDEREMLEEVLKIVRSLSRSREDVNHVNPLSLMALENTNLLKDDIRKLTESFRVAAQESLMKANARKAAATRLEMARKKRSE